MLLVTLAIQIARLTVEVLSNLLKQLIYLQQFL